MANPNPAEPGEIQVVIPTWWRPTFDAAVAMLGLELFPIPGRYDDLPTYGVGYTDTTIQAALQTVRERAQTSARLWPCGCLPNEAGAHRGGCPAYCRECHRIGTQLPAGGWVIVHVPGCSAKSEEETL